MKTRSWIGDVITATTRGQCNAYVEQATMARRRGLICKRIGTQYLTVDNLMPQGPFCHQHALIYQDRATALSIGNYSIVRLNEVTK